MLLDKAGKLTMRDTQNGFAVKWQTGTGGRGDTDLSIQPGKQKGVNRLAAWSRCCMDPVKFWNIGPANKVVISNSGQLVGYRGKKRIWTADTLQQAHKKGLAAARRLHKQQLRRRKLKQKKRRQAAAKKKSRRSLTTNVS